MKKKFLKNSSLAVAISIGAAHPAMAIDLGLEEVVVTAQFREQSIQDVPLAITAISGVQLENAGISDYRDLVNLTPGIQMSSFSLGNPGLAIRGIQSSILDLASEPAVALYVDGVYIKRSVEQLVDLERVEILRGPQGTLYGRNTTAGVLSFITKKPGPDLDAKLVFEAARFNTFTARGYVSGAIADNLFGKISFSERRGDHPATNLVKAYPFSKRKSDLVRATLVWDAAENAEFTLIGDYQNDRTPGAIGTPVKTETVAFGGFGPFGPIVNQVVLFDPTSTDPNLNPTGQIATSNLAGMQDEPEKDNREEYGISLTGNIDLSFGTLTTISAFRDYKHEVTTDVDGTPCVLSAPFFIGELFRDLNGVGSVPGVKCFTKGDPLLVALGLPGSQWAGNNSTNSEQITQEVRIASKDGGPMTFDGKLDWVFGFFYYNEKGVSVRRTDINGRINAHGFDSTIDVNAYAGFGQLVYHTTDRFNITLGGRYTTESKNYMVSGFSRPLTGPHPFIPGARVILAGWDTQPSFDFANLPFTFQSPPGGGAPVVPVGTDAVCALNTRCIPETRVSNTFRSFDPKLTLDYAVSDDAMVFASVGTGFKSGGFNGTPVSLAVGIDPYKAEDVTAYEAGFKAGFLDNKVRVNFNAFYYDYRNEQIFGNFDHDKNTATPTALLTRNAAHSTKQGFEIESFFVVTERLKVRATYAYLDATYGDFPVFSGPVEIDNFKGNTAVQAPKHSASISVDWLLPVPENMGDLLLRVDGNYRSKQFYVVENLPENVQEKYDLWNVNLIWQPTDELRVSLWGKNIFDKEYLNHKFQAGAPNLVLPFGVFDASRERSRAGAPRTFGVTVSYQFGG